MRVFVSYSHKDEKWLDRVVSAIRAAAPEADIHAWSDREIAGGDNFERVIHEQIDRADVGVLLLSHDFLSSQFIRRRELPRLQGLYTLGELRIVPVLVRHCKPPKWLRELQLRPSMTVSLEATGTDADRELTRIGEEVVKSRRAGAAAVKVQLPTFTFVDRLRAWLDYVRLDEPLASPNRPSGSRGRGLPSVDFQQFRSRPPAEPPPGRVVVITGPAGTGKTRYLSEVTRKLPADAVVVPIRATEIRPDCFEEDFWANVVKAFWPRSSSESDLQPTLRAVQHMLASKHVVFVVEDLHIFGTDEFITAFRRFFERHLRWRGSRVRLLATSRSAAAAELAETVDLQPLSDQDARNLFESVVGDDLAKEVRPFLHEAFQSRVTATPLVVLLSAKLVREHRNDVDAMAAILRMKASALLQKFVDTLVGRSGGGAELARWYTTIATVAWPDATVSLAKITTETALDEARVDVLVRAGLLADASDEFERVVAFPHHAMVEYLVARDSLAGRGISWVGAHADTKTDGVVDFLAALCDSREALAFMVERDPRLLLRFAARDANYLRAERFGDRPLLVAALAAALARAGVAGVPLPYDSWKELFGWVNDFSATLSGIVAQRLQVEKPTPAAAAVLLATQKAPARDLLSGWFRGQPSLLQEVEHADAAAFYVAFIDRESLRNASSVIAVNCLAAQRRHGDAIFRRLCADVTALPHEVVSGLTSAGEFGYAVLAATAACASHDTRRTVAAAVSKANGGKLLIPPMTYMGIDAGMQAPDVRSIVITAPLLVPVRPKAVVGRNWADAVNRVKAEVDVDKLLEYEELCVVYKEYRTAGADGLIDVAASTRSVVEAVKLYRKNRTPYFGFAWLVPPDVVRSATPGKDVRVIWYRDVERCRGAAGLMHNLVNASPSIFGGA